MISYSIFLNNSLTFCLIHFSKLFFKTDILDYNSYIQILEKIGIKIPDFFEKVRKIDLLAAPPPIEIKPSITPIQKKLPIDRPKTPAEKISNPSKLEPVIIEVLKEKILIKSKALLIQEVIPFAKSQNVINNAISNLREKNLLQYSRKSPQGWSLVN